MSALTQASRPLVKPKGDIFKATLLCNGSFWREVLLETLLKALQVDLRGCDYAKKSERSIQHYGLPVKQSFSHRDTGTSAIILSGRQFSRLGILVQPDEDFDLFKFTQGCHTAGQLNLILSLRRAETTFCHPQFATLRYPCRRGFVSPR